MSRKSALNDTGSDLVSRRRRIKNLAWITVLGVLLAAPSLCVASPEEDLQAFRAFFQKRHPDVKFEEFANGIYAIDPVMRANWEAIEEFPPYELYIDSGKKLFEKPFKNGKGYAGCFPNGGLGIAQNYPQWDKQLAKVLTLAAAINRCREKNAEKPLRYGKGELADILAYMAFTSRGNPTNVLIPKDDPRALAAYNAGKQFYFARRGQLNFSCSGCHLQATGQLLRANRLSPALGQTTNWPAYRSRWGAMGTLHRRYRGCLQQVRAKPFKYQSEEYSNLEYFHTYISNGIPLNGPSTRQ
ncbi:MAG: sulfur oxidation c-type cytochrome SoxA [Gammaproteobacteria bacterium]